MEELIVSIIIPVKNGERFIDKVIKNLKFQSYNYIEIIFIDNKSTDNTIKKLKTYSDIKYFTCKKGKAGDARNVGIKKAQGQFILFLDVDDFISNEAFEVTSNLKNGDVVLLENLRFYPGEKKGDKDFAQKLSKHQVARNFRLGYS